MSLRFFTLLIVAVFQIGLTNAQTHNFILNDYSSLSSSSLWNHNIASINSSGNIKLTTSTVNLASYMYTKDSFNYTNTCFEFDVKYKYSFDYTSTYAADGMTFFFATSPFSAFGYGNALALPSNLKGLAVIFDFYDNGYLNRPSGKNFSISVMNFTGTNSYYEGSNIGTGKIGHAYYTIDKNSTVDVRITYINGTVKVYINNDMIINVAHILGSGVGRFGFTGSTGLIHSEQSLSNINIQAKTFLSTQVSNAQLCQVQKSTYKWRNKSLNQSLSNQTLYDTLKYTSSNCDSIILIHNVTFHPNIPTRNLSQTICESALPYNWNGNIITTTGVHTLSYSTNSLVTGCDSVTNLNLTVNPSSYGTQTAVICEGQSYTFNGITYTSSNTTAKDTFVNARGCDSIVTLNLTVNPRTYGIQTAVICEGQSYTFNGITYTTSNTTAKDTFVNAKGCDSIVTLNLTVNPRTYGTHTAVICEGQSYTFNGITYTTSYTTAKDTFVNAKGCDSIVTLNLTVNPRTYGTQTVVICEGQSYTFNGITYTTSNTTAKDTFLNAKGCDSIVTLNLTVNPRTYGTQTVVICEGQSYTFNGITYTTSNTTAKDTIVNAKGCDSIVTLNLTVNPRTYGTQTVVICEGQSYTFNGITYTTSNTTAKDTLINAKGCDSIVTLNLTVNPVHRDTVAHYVCSTDLPFVFNGQSYNLAGYHTQNYTNQYGCDSTVILNLSISEPTRDTLITDVACDSISFENRTYFKTTNINDTLRNTMGCDSVYRSIRLQVNYSHHFTITEEICADQQYEFHGQVYSRSGVYNVKYTNMMGCDSIYTLRLTVNPLPDVRISNVDLDRNCISDTMILVANGAKHYTWEGWVVSQQLDSAWVRLGQANNTYIVLGLDSNGCTKTAQMNIMAEDCCEIGVPNAFSPNNDGLNDLFKIVAPGNPKRYYLSIFNRYGQQVFISHKVGEGWDGSINGEPAEIGTYNYILETECSDGTQMKRVGTIHLLR